MISSIELGGMSSTGALDCERWTAREGVVLSVGARVSKCRTTTYALREGMMQKQRLLENISDRESRVTCVRRMDEYNNDNKLSQKT